MPDIIQLLPDHVANQIAAGEVVQRPSSVVKELLENAIDAQATYIHLVVKDAGKSLIQVIDNGCGMSETDARMCFERHATSKIKDAKDLFNLNTKGFRGEAMASIAAIAQVELKSKLKDRDLGTHLVIEGSKFVKQDVIPTPEGTNIVVKNLFFNIPARRNFLKSDAVETRHIIDELQRVALVHHNIHFVLNHNNSEIFNLPPTNLKQRIVNIFGHKTNERLLPISEETEEVKLEGFIVKPEFSKKKRGEQFFFVNQRYIKSPYLHHAINAAFEGLIEKSHYPSYFLYLTVPNESIDINIHPTKTEVKFDNEKILYEVLKSATKHALGQFNVVSSLNFYRDETMETPYEYKDKPIVQPKIQVDPNFNPFQREFNGINPFESSEKKSEISSMPKKEKQFQNTPPQKTSAKQWETLYNGLESMANVAIEKEKLSPELFEKQQKTTIYNTYQVFNKYILCHSNEGTFVVHQHLAHQRVLYENFLANITVKEASSQQLLFPITISFNKQETIILHNLKEELQSTGFVFEEIENEHVTVSGIPTSITESQISIVFEQLIEDFNQDIEENSFSQLDMISKSLAKTLAIKTGTKLTEAEQENLIQNLFTCKETQTSPFRKKIYHKIDLKTFEKLFF